MIRACMCLRARVREGVYIEDAFIDCLAVKRGILRRRSLIHKGSL